MGKQFLLNGENPSGVRFANSPGFRQVAKRGAKRAGLAFERDCHDKLGQWYDTYMPGPWFQFYASGRTRHAQPDGLIFDFSKREIILVEIKLSHCARAFRQLELLYGPLVSAIFPDWSIRRFEVCRHFDPAVRLPSKLGEVGILRSGFERRGRSDATNVVVARP